MRKLLLAIGLLLATSAHGVVNTNSLRYSPSYTDITTAINAVGNTELDIYIPDAQTVDDLTIPAKIRLHFLDDAVITVNNGMTLTFDTKSIYAPNRPIFAGTGNVDFAAGTEVDVAWFADADEALAELTDDEVVLLMSGASAITSNVALGGGITLLWESSGNEISVSGGVTLSNVNDVIAGSYQIFAGAGLVSFVNGTHLDSAWFVRLRTALDLISTTEVLLEIRRTETIDVTVAANANTILELFPGGLLSPNGGVTLTVNGDVFVYVGTATDYVTGAGTVVFNGSTGFLSSVGSIPDTTVTNPGLGTANDFFGWIVSPSASLTDHGLTGTAGTLAYALDNADAGDRIYIPPAGQNYVITTAISSSLDSVTIQCAAGVILEAGTDGIFPVTLTGDHIMVEGCKFEGEGTFVTDTTGWALYGLLKVSGDYATVQNCHFLDPETFGLMVFEGDYAIVRDNVFEGGPYFANAAAVGSDRQHFGVGFKETDYSQAVGNQFIPNSEVNAGNQLQGIYGVTNVHMTITDNTFYDQWDTGMYIECQGCTVSDNVSRLTGIKIQMAQGAVEGNVISGNTIYIDNLSAPLRGGNGIIVNNARWCTIDGNIIKGANNYGLVLNTLTSFETEISYNVISNNTIQATRDVGGGAGEDSSGIVVYNNVDEFSHNVITGNTITDISDNLEGQNNGIYLDLNDTALHVGNIISNNVFFDIQESCIFANYLTESIISNNYFEDCPIGEVDTTIRNDDATSVHVHHNMAIGDGTYMEWFYREENGDSNIIEHNILTNLVSNRGLVRALDLSDTAIIRNNTDGRSDYQSYTTASARTITARELFARTQLRDPNGAARNDTFPTAANMITEHIQSIGSRVAILYINVADAAEAITLVAGANMTLTSNEGAGDLIVDQNDAALVTFINIDDTNVTGLVQKFE